MEIKGTIVEIKSTETKGATNFQVRNFAIEVQNPRDPQYNDFFEFQLTGQRCALMDSFSVGQFVSVTYDIRGRKWTGSDNQVHYYNSLAAFNVIPVEQGTTFTPSAANVYTAQANVDISSNPTDDLPF